LRFFGHPWGHKRWHERSAAAACGEVRFEGYLLRVEEVDGSRVARVVARKEPS
jgi:hypothetical protein